MNWLTRIDPVRFEVERDIAQLRSVQRTLGASVSWIVDTLLLDGDAGQSDERAKKVQESKREALEALAYVRDLLISGSTDVDEDETARALGQEAQPLDRAVSRDDRPYSG